MSTPEPGDKVIDSRDVIARFEELKGERDALVSELDEAKESGDEECQQEASDELEEWDGDNGEEFKNLKDLIEECEGYGDWEYGETLIHRDYWVEYCQQLLEDCGDIPRNLPGYIVIDWEATADNLECDYYVVDFGDEEYLIRSC